MKASFYGFNGFDKSIFRHGKMVLLISVGQPYHEGDRLAATVHLLSKYFSNCEVVLADTLQRHTYMARNNGIDVDAAKRIAYESGTKWISDNLDILNSFVFPFTISRWDSWLERKEFVGQKDVVRKLYCLNDNYQKCIDSTISKFVERNSRYVHSDEDLKRFCDNSLNYLIEECAVIMPMWAGQGVNWIVYPKENTEAMAATRDLFVTDPSLVRWVPIRFKRRGKR
ncbi:MAG: tRNA-dependent cyclodipeptide synthase [Gammaproteobacteria bacterium]|nr:tRNA-dependent cyclodipeptide synthase [Gammaproteobacteria bacterium]